MSELYDFWTPVRLHGPTDIMASPEQVEELQDYFKEYSIENRLKIGNIQQ